MINRRKRRLRRKQTIADPAGSWWAVYSWLLIIGGFILLATGVIAWKELRVPLGKPAASTEFMEQSRPFEITYGRNDAPVTIIEYASLTCGSCKHFHEQVFKPLEKTYIQNGQVRFVFRHFPLNAAALDAALLLSCLSPEISKQVINTLFANQDIWAAADDPREYFRVYFSESKITDVNIENCLNDSEKRDALVAEQQKARETLSISSTPTVFINGRLYNGQKRFEPVRRVVDIFLKKSEG